MATFGQIARRVIVEASLDTERMPPDYVLLWLKARYSKIFDTSPFSRMARRATSILNTDAEKVAGTISAARGSATITGVGTSFASGDVGRYLRGSRIWYRVSAVAGALSLSLDKPWAEDDISASGYWIASRYFQIPDSVRWVRSMKMPDWPGPFDETTEQELDWLSAERALNPSRPQKWAPVGYAGSPPRRQIEVYPFPDKIYRLEANGFADIDEPTLASSPLPDIDDEALVVGGLADGFSYKAGLAADKGEVQRAEALLAMSNKHARSFSVWLEQLGHRNLDEQGPQVGILGLSSQARGVYRDIITAEDHVWSR